ncbi:hypothetical protein ED312_08700 [Sinomicrobium pectinilyticum]|uniref:Secreted protein n=1 Tax=Sinomicrobium pectinilyticum TaxID=1084421 RepID=A0A3N0EKT6_SINP1|nr:DUF6520 family protein [Sinomicrobium pectinilyticum]RNL88516.1 hypothetical protein ED312_08700 [Sinomicrobium pectinilyticum]
MKKMNFVLPAMAFIFTIAVSFASARLIDTQDEGTFIQQPGICQSVPAECGEGEELCEFQEQQVYQLRNETETECSVELHRPSQQ